MRVNFGRCRQVISYNYECPVCGKGTSTAAVMCTHMCQTRDLYAEHANWMQSRGIDYFKVCKSGKGSRKSLMEVVERECRIT